MSSPRIHAIFHRQLPGDRALLRLAQQRFGEAGLGAELYPTSPDELETELAFAPSDEPVTVHLPRNLQVLDRRHHDRIAAFAARSPKHVYGLVVHDQPEAASRFPEYVDSARALDKRLKEAGPGPWVFVEYAAGIEPGWFVEMAQALGSCDRVSVCIDISHVGIRQCQLAWQKQFPGEQDVCGLKPGHPKLAERAEEVQAVVALGLPTVKRMVTTIGRVGKPLHFHLHDGHPASTFSAFGVSDHLSFFQEIPVPFSYRGARSLPTLFGPLGLHQIVSAARAALPDDKLSFTLEIHAQDRQLDLGPHAELFAHWRDHGNARRMNHWVEVLLRNHRLLREACG